VKKTRKIALLGILGAQALALSFLENLLPPMPFLMPGAKPGFSNIVTMFTAGTMGLGAALYITVIKALFALWRGGVTAMLMSLAGGILSTLVMWLLFRLKNKPFGYIGVGILSALAHNTGQLLVSMALLNAGVLGYIPVLIIFSLVTGALTGTVLKVIMPVLERQSKYFMRGNHKP